MQRCAACGSEHPLSFFSAKQRKFAKERRQCLTCEESSAGVLVQAGRGRPRLAAGEIASRFHAQWHFTVGLENDRRGTIERSHAAFRGNVRLRRLAFRLRSGNLEGYAAFARNVSNKQLADLLSVPRQNVWEGAAVEWPFIAATTYDVQDVTLLQAAADSTQKTTADSIARAVRLAWREELRTREEEEMGADSEDEDDEDEEGGGGDGEEQAINEDEEDASQRGQRQKGSNATAREMLDELSDLPLFKAIRSERWSDGLGPTERMVAAHASQNGACSPSAFAHLRTPA